MLTASITFGDDKESVNKHRNIDLRLITEYQQSAVTTHYFPYHTSQRHHP